MCYVKCASNFTHCFSDVFVRTLTVDGNMKADHVKQKNPEDDVFLMSGEAFMTEPIRYQAHLRDATMKSSRYRLVKYYLLNVTWH